MEPFRNEPLAELRSSSVRGDLEAALRGLDQRLPLEIPILVGNDPDIKRCFDSIDPGCDDRIVAVSASANSADVAAALEAAASGFHEWSSRSVLERAEVLLRGAGKLREDRLHLVALVVRECAKPWPDADADVAEAIDFLEYYARTAVDLLSGQGNLMQVPGERNTATFASRGITAVIAPWNFPIAIPVGMISAALATGNSVAFKPAEQAPACGHRIVELLRSAGVPNDALNLLPGGDEPAKALVRSPNVHTIAFTGSGAVGLEIMAAASRVVPGQAHLKRVVAEMGGKNCVIVDSDADLDEVVPALLTSAFGFAGQKCSAASKVLVHDAIADSLIERLAGSVETLVVDQAERFGVDVPPVIDAASHQRVEKYIEIGKGDGGTVLRGPAGPKGGYFCAPALVADLNSDSAVLREEIFGPVLAVERVASVADACRVVEASPFALTGGLFCRNPDTVAEVVRRSPVGNLYVNRGTTGAMVGRQPFGGNRLSGNGTKAGGPDYLRHFVDPRVVCENTMRHGLVVS